jgi:hypothetical protein
VKRKDKKIRRGFTIVELIMAAVATLIVLSAVTVLLVDSQRGFNKLYSNINSNIIEGSFIAKNRFDSVVRKSSGQNCLIDTDGHWIEVYYYQSGSSPSVDRYARFYRDVNSLRVEYGLLNPKQTISFETICGNVSKCNFKKVGSSAQMLLTLSNDKQTTTTVSSAFMHN